MTGRDTIQDSHAGDSYSLRPSPNDTGFSYKTAVDGLKGVAILLVLWYHAPFLFRDLPEFSPTHTPWGAFGMFGTMSLGGWIGVDLFFVVSGFLITSILLHVRAWEGATWAFWGRRGLRILPLAMAYLVTLWCLVWLGDPLKLLPHFEAWSWYVLYLGNIHITLNGWQPLALMILWSLAIEEQFYLIWPWVVHSCGRYRLLYWSLGMMALAPVIRATMLSIADYPATYVFTLCRVDALAAGAVVAILFGTPLWQAEAARLCERFTLLASFLVLITFLVPFSPSLPQTRPWFFSVFGYSWLAMSFAIILGATLSAEGSVGALLKSPILTFIGRRCYGLYLWHVFIAGCVLSLLKPFELGFWAHVSVWLTALVLVAVGSWSFFEEPILRLKRFLPYRREMNSQSFLGLKSDVALRSK